MTAGSQAKAFLSYKGRRQALWVQLLFTALFAAVILGLLLLKRNGRSAILYWVLLPACLFFTPRAWLPDIKAVWSQWWSLDRRETRRLLLTVFAAALAFCLFAHGFLFTNEFFSHDSLILFDYGNRANTFNTQVKIGRILIPLYEFLKGPIAAPWLVGLLYFLWMSLASVLTVRVLHLENFAAIILTVALLCSNRSLAVTGASYVYCMDEYALALLFAAAAAWFFCCCQHGWILGIVCLVAVLSIYQSYFTVVAALCFFSLLPDVIHNEKPFLTIRRGLYYLSLLAVSFAIYSFSWKVICRLLNLERSRTSSTILSLKPPQILQRIIDAYQGFFSDFGRDNGMIVKLAPALAILVVTGMLVWLVRWLLDENLVTENKVLLLFAVLLLPLVFKAHYLLFLVGDQSLISFNLGLPGVFLLFCSGQLPDFSRSRRFRTAAAVLALALVWQNVVFANEAYIKREVEKSASLSVVTRILVQIEQLDGYIPNETPVAFVGWLPGNPLLSRGRSGFSAFDLVHEGALTYDYAPSYNMHSYIIRYLNYPLRDVAIDSSLEEVQAMPIFPYAGSVQWVGDTVVVKLSN